MGPGLLPVDCRHSHARGHQTAHSAAASNPTGNDPGASYFTIWTTLDDASPDNGAKHILPGSQHFNADGLPWQEVTARATDPDEDREKVVLTATAGESYLLNLRVLHSSDPNPTGCRRQAMNVIYMPAGTRITPDPEGTKEQERRRIELASCRR